MVDGIELHIGTRPVGTVFDLLGVMEDDLTYSFGWALARAPALMAGFAAWIALEQPGRPVSVDLQKSSDKGGYTDIEVRYDDAHVIVEAKRGWVLPTSAQLAKYRPRLLNDLRSVLVVVSEATSAYAVPRLPTQVDNVPVQYLAWRQVIDLTEQSASASRNLAERRLLREFARYLRGAVRMQDLFSNWTYCVVVSPRTPAGWPFSFRDVVDQGRYFHPYGVSGWPKTPPNYLAFRWAGAVQRIHHVEDYTVGYLHEEFPGIPDVGPDTAGSHLIYKLGPAIGPTAPLPSGAQYRAGRMWVALDLLLTESTLKDALSATRKRQAQGVS